MFWGRPTAAAVILIVVLVLVLVVLGLIERLGRPPAPAPATAAPAGDASPHDIADNVPGPR